MIVYLNGEYMPAEEARISPFDRGFLFGDGIYEVTPSYEGKMVGFSLHLERMKRGLAQIGIDASVVSDEQWRDIAENLIERNGCGDLGIYFHVSRGNEGRRFHGFPDDTPVTVFAMINPIGPAPSSPDRRQWKGLAAVSAEDMRWRRCNVKSTALLGNVLHFQFGADSGCNETILYNQKGELTEASHSNVFIVKDGVVSTPPLDNQILPGISRHIVLDILRQQREVSVEERVISMEEVRNCDELWITNSSKHIAPIVTLDGDKVGDGKVGAVWEYAIRLYEKMKYSY